MIKTNELLRYHNNLVGFHIGIVTSNTDPKQLDRVQASIPGIFEGDKSLFPWCAKIATNDFGVGTSGNSSRPEVGSKVLIFFLNEDIYSPVYMGGIVDSTSIANIFQGSYGFKDPAGNIFKVNVNTGLVEYTHASGTKLTIAQNGETTIHSADKLHIDSTGDMTVVSGGNLDVTSTGPTSLTSGGTLDVTSSGATTINSGGTTDITSSGNTTVTAPKIVCAGNMELNGAASGITTKNSHQGVIDLITGVPVTPSTTVKGDI